MGADDSNYRQDRHNGHSLELVFGTLKNCHKYFFHFFFISMSLSLYLVRAARYGAVLLLSYRFTDHDMLFVFVELRPSEFSDQNKFQ